ncbi:MAG: hypothetical protein WBP47_13895 [Candidatus Promineifilaceae bacterium]
MQFLRATQTNGRFDPHSDGRSLPLSPEAFAFWQEHGAVIANLLRPETPLPLSAVVEAYAEYQLEHPEGGVDVGADAGGDEVYVAWALLKLVSYGLAQVVMPSGAYHRPRHHQPRPLV